MATVGCFNELIKHKPFLDTLSFHFVYMHTLTEFLIEAKQTTICNQLQVISDVSLQGIKINKPKSFT